MTNEEKSLLKSVLNNLRNVHVSHEENIIPLLFSIEILKKLLEEGENIGDVHTES